MSSPETPPNTKTTTPEPPAPEKPISLYEQASNLVLHRILLALSSPNLLPSDLGRLASATATLTRANAYAQTAKLQRKYLRVRIAKLTPPPEEDFYSPENLEKLRARVRAIYGIDWDFNNPPSWDAEEPDNFPGFNSSPPTGAGPASTTATSPQTSIFPAPQIPYSTAPRPSPSGQGAWSPGANPPPPAASPPISQARMHPRQATERPENRA